MSKSGLSKAVAFAAIAGAMLLPAVASAAPSRAGGAPAPVTYQTCPSRYAYTISLGNPWISTPGPYSFRVKSVSCQSALELFRNYAVRGTFLPNQPLQFVNQMSDNSGYWDVWFTPGPNIDRTMPYVEASTAEGP